MGCVVDSPVFVFYNYHSIPLPPAGVVELVAFVTSKQSNPLTRFIFCCDVRHTPADVLETVETLDKCEIEHFSLPRLITLLADRMRRYASIDGLPTGTISLITDCGGFEEAMRDIIDGGWQFVLFYPPYTHIMALLEHATLAFPLPVNSVPLEQNYVVYGENGFNEGEIMPNEDSESLVGSAASQHSGWRHASSQPRSPPTAPFVFENNNSPLPRRERNGPKGPSGPRGSFASKINGFNAPSFAQEAKNKPNPFNKNPFDAPDAEDNGPFGNHNANNANANSRNRNPFGQAKAAGSRFQASQMEEKIASGEFPTRPFGTQCPQWEDRRHSSKSGCQLYHPRKPCLFFPRCRMTAEACFYAHPFCNGGECMCGEGARNPQLNHYSAGNQMM